MQSSVFVINGAKSLYGFDDITLCPDWHRGEDEGPGEIWLRRHTLYIYLGTQNPRTYENMVIVFIYGWFFEEKKIA